MYILASLLIAMAPQAHVPVFNALRGYVNTPDLSAAGLKPIKVLGGELWPSKADERQAEKSTDLPTSVESSLRAVAQRLDAKTTPLVCLDIEWRIAEDTPHAAANRAKLMRVADIFHEAAPGVHIGFYGILPVVDYWRSIEAADSAKFRSWHAENVRVLEIARHVDVVFPSLYTFYDNLEGWVRYARANLSEARLYGKPIYPFLWPEYHNSNRFLAGNELPGPFWSTELSTVAQAADGIVIWGWGANHKQWNSSSPWWMATESYLRSSGAKAR
jgi:hypothetical protein